MRYLLLFTLTISFLPAFALDRYEAEDATVTSNVTQDEGWRMTNPSAGNSAFFNNIANEYIEFTVNVASAENYDITFAYSATTNGTTPQSKLYINDAEIETFSWTVTGDLKITSSLEKNISLNAGSNTIKIVHLSKWLCIDYLEIEGSVASFNWAKLEKGVNQDVNTKSSGIKSKIQHEKAHMEAISEAGFESVRIFLPYSADYTMFEERIQDALDYNLAVVVCLWGSTDWNDASNADLTEFTDKWTTITQAWKNKFSNDVVFEILNDPESIGFDPSNDTDNTNVMKFLDAGLLAIRAEDDDRPILVGSLGNNDPQYLDAWFTTTHLTNTYSNGKTFFTDSNCGVAIHIYTWGESTLDLPADWKATIDGNISDIVNWKNNNTINPVVVTEWGAWMFDERTASTDLSDWLDYTILKFNNNDIGSMWYAGIQSNQKSFNIFNSETGWNAVVLKALTGVEDPFVPATSQIIDSEFIGYNSDESWRLTSETNVTSSFVSWANALSGQSSIKLAVSSPTDSQLYQESSNDTDGTGRTLLQLIKDETYEISFMAKATAANGQITVLLQDADNLSTNFFESSTQTVSTTSETFTLKYTHTEENAMNVRLAFDIGAKVQTLTLDNVSLKRTGVVKDLPVSLTYFNGQTAAEGNLLTWQTASETNSSHFDIEVSQNRKNWSVIGTVPAAGNSNVTINYQFLDSQLKGNYYRLAQYDLDSTLTYYGDINITTVDNLSFSINVFPTYTKSESKVTIEITGINNSEPIAGVFYDLNGKILSEEIIPNNNGSSKNLVSNLAIPKVKRGLYLLKISNGFHSKIAKLFIH